MALDAVKGERTELEPTAEYGLHPTIIHQWKRSRLDGTPGIDDRGGKVAVAAEVAEETVRDLYACIGELAVTKVLFHKSSSPQLGTEARDDRTGPAQANGRGAMPPDLYVALVVLLRVAE